MDEYSARKNITKIAEECSTMKPATSSDSASAKSKGPRLVSAKAPMKKVMSKGNNGKASQTIF